MLAASVLQARSRPVTICVKANAEAVSLSAVLPRPVLLCHKPRASRPRLSLQGKAALKRRPHPSEGTSPHNLSPPPPPPFPPRAAYTPPHTEHILLAGQLRSPRQTDDERVVLAQACRPRLSGRSLRVKIRMRHICGMLLSSPGGALAGASQMLLRIAPHDRACSQLPVSLTHGHCHGAQSGLGQEDRLITC